MALTYYVDYDRAQLPGLSYLEKVSYLENRLQKILLKPLNEMLQRIKYDPKDYSPILIYANSICCAIEAMGRFMDGSMKTKSNIIFKAFLKKYMHPDFSSKKYNGELYGKLLWDDHRNGIAHCFYIKNGGLEVMGQNFRHQNDKGDPMFEIEPEFLLKDLESGVSKYIADLKAANPTESLAVKFVRVFDATYIRGK